MKHFTGERMFRGKPITAEMTATDCGVQVGLYGGDTPHIGAVGIVDPDGNIRSRSLKGTKKAFSAGSGVKHWPKPRIVRLLCPPGCITIRPAGRRSCRSSGSAESCCRKPVRRSERAPLECCVCGRSGLLRIPALRAKMKALKCPCMKTERMAQKWNLQRSLRNGIPARSSENARWKRKS